MRDPTTLRRFPMSAQHLSTCLGWQSPSRDATGRWTEYGTIREECQVGVTVAGARIEHAYGM